MAVRADLFQSPDYYLVDELLTEEHKLIRDTVRNYVKKEISPIIEEYAERAEFPQQIVQQMGDLGCFGPTVPTQYGGGGLDYISYGLMMQEWSVAIVVCVARQVCKAAWSCFLFINMVTKHNVINTCPNWQVANGWDVLV